MGNVLHFGICQVNSLPGEDLLSTNITATRPTQGVPGDLIDLTRWYLTLPIKDPTGKDTSGPWDVYPPALRHFSWEYFRVPSVESVPVVEYTAPVNGTTTSGSGATRCELREMAGG